jgi:hypothetical protein
MPSRLAIGAHVVRYLGPDRRRFVFRGPGFLTHNASTLLTYADRRWHIATIVQSVARAAHRSVSDRRLCSARESVTSPCRSNFRCCVRPSQPWTRAFSRPMTMSV